MKRKVWWLSVIREGIPADWTSDIKSMGAIG